MLYNLKTNAILFTILTLIMFKAYGQHGAFFTSLQRSKSYAILHDSSIANKKAIDITRTWKGKRCKISIKNTSHSVKYLNEIVLFDFSHGLPANSPIYGEGFQMLSQNGGTLARPEDLGSFTDREHYRIPEPENMRTSYGLFSFTFPDGASAILATTSCRRFISRFSYDDKRLRISLDTEGLQLKAGEIWQLESFEIFEDSNRSNLFKKLSASISENHPRLAFSAPPAGWCSWYCFGPKVSSEDVTKNVKWISSNAKHLEYIQIDDGYQPWMGDWLDAGQAFDGGVDKVINNIRSAGLKAAIWVAPFIASPQSKLFREHPDWMVKDSMGRPLRSDRIGFGGWRQGPWYVLDGTNPEVQFFFTSLFEKLNKVWGCSYFKLDANYWGAIHKGVHYDKNATRIEAYRRGMQAIRKGAGDAFILGCNHPIWASLGEIHGSRSSMDIWRDWKSFKNIARENFLRAWQNNTLWWNDPDCLLLLNEGAGDIMDQGGNEKLNAKIHLQLTNDEFRYHATAVYASGGMILSGDDLTKMPAEKIAILKKLIPPNGRAAEFENDSFEVGTIVSEDKIEYCVFNNSDRSQTRIIRLPPGKFAISERWSNRRLGEYSGQYIVEGLRPHSALILEATKI